MLEQEEIFVWFCNAGSLSKLQWLIEDLPDINDGEDEDKEEESLLHGNLSSNSTFFTDS